MKTILHLLHRNLKRTIKAEPYARVSVLMLFTKKSIILMNIPCPSDWLIHFLSLTAIQKLFSLSIGRMQSNMRAVRYASVLSTAQAKSVPKNENILEEQDKQGFQTEVINSLTDIF